MGPGAEREEQRDDRGGEANPPQRVLEVDWEFGEEDPELKQKSPRS